MYSLSLALVDQKKSASRFLCHQSQNSYQSLTAPRPSQYDPTRRSGFMIRLILVVDVARVIFAVVALLHFLAP